MDRDLAPAAPTSEPAPALAPRRPLPDELRGVLERSYAADLSEVRVVEDGTAERLGKLAAARGCDVHVARGAYDPVGDAGRRVIAHEVAHVVQQGAAPTVGAPVAADADADFEAEANVAARAALRGEPARLSRGRAAVGFQGHDSDEHKLLGDFATGGATYQFGDLTLTHGDLNLLADYFGAATLPDLLANPSGDPGSEVGTRDEVLAALKEALPLDHRFGDGGVWAHLTISATVRAVMKQRFARRAVDNIEHFARPREHADDPRSAGHTYRSQHEAAIWTAYVDGSRGRAIDRGMIVEAIAEHYLEDSFAAGHVRTPRADIKEFWDVAIPWFKTSFVRSLTSRITDQLAGQSDFILYGLTLPFTCRLPVLDPDDPSLVVGAYPLFDNLERVALAGQVRDQLLATIGAENIPGFGEIVSLVLHDEDNAAGVLVENDVGWVWTTFGDGKLADHPTQGVPIVKAIQLGCLDVEQAHRFGRVVPDRSHERSRDELLAMVRAATQVPAHPGDRYGAEQIAPRPVSGANGAQTWRATGFDDLLCRPVRTDRPGKTFLLAILEECMPGGAIYDKLDEAKDGLPESKAVVFRPRSAFESGVLGPLRGNPIAFLHDIITGNP